MKDELNFLVANLGSETLRAFAFFDTKDIFEMNNSIKRCNDILERIKELEEAKPRMGEINNLEMVINDLSSESRYLKVSKEDISNFFNPFAIRLMSK